MSSKHVRSKVCLKILALVLLLILFQPHLVYSVTPNGAMLSSSTAETNHDLGANPSVASDPHVPAAAPDDNTSSGVMTLSFQYYNYSEISVYNRSLVIYLTESNVSVATYVMTGGELSNFSNNLPELPIFKQNGTFNYDALLLTPGTYYLVLYAATAPAKINYFVDVGSNLDVRNSTTSVGEFVNISANSQLSFPVHLETLGSPSTFHLMTVSNQTLSYSIYDKSTNTTVFTSPDVTISNLSFSSTGAYSLGYNVSLAEGEYSLFITNGNSAPTFMYFEYEITPQFVDPYLVGLFHSSPARPTGIASYGVSNNSGSISTYVINSSAIAGFADVSSISTFNPNVPAGVAPDEVSLQLNAVLSVKDSDNSTKVYWPQNVVAFFTNSSQIELDNNVLNVTGDSATLTNSTITSPNGFVVSTPSGDYYGNYVNHLSAGYALPLSFIAILEESVVSGRGVQIRMGMDGLENGTSLNLKSNVTWFDTILIVDPQVSSASFVVSGEAYTPAGAAQPLGTFYDAEFVLGGGGNGAGAHFGALSADLSLFYLNSATNLFRSFPSVYSFGGDTAETVDNVHATDVSDQYVSLSTGTPDYVLLSDSFNSSVNSVIGLISAASQTSTSIAQSTNTQTVTSSLMRTSATTSNSPATTQATSTSSAPTVRSPNSGLLGNTLVDTGLVVAVVVVFAAVLALRQRSMKRAQAQGEMRGTTTAAGPLRVCRNCGTTLEPGELFCPNCGTRYV